MERKYKIYEKSSYPKIGEKYKMSMDSQVPEYMILLPGMYFSFEMENKILKFLILDEEGDYLWIERVE